MAKEQYEALSDSVIEYFKGIESSFAMPMDIKFTFVANSKQKKLIKISKIADTYAYLLDSDLLVTFNEDYFENFDDNSKQILVEQEIDRIEFDLEKGTISITSEPEIHTSSGIIEKFSLKSVENANKLQKEYEKQKKDKKEQEESQKTPLAKKGYTKRR